MLSEVQHQEEATKYLRRVVEGAVVPPLLLVGPPGVGKRYSVHCMLREILCTGSKSSSCSCAACYQLARGLHPDVLVLAPAKRVQVEDVRGLVEEARVCPTASRFKTLVVDGADLFTTEAADALLKTLEEPPKTTRFFLLAVTLERVPKTIRSRCATLVYLPLPESFIVSIVQQLESDDSKALVYSRMSGGSVGQAVALCGAGKLALRDNVLRGLREGVRGDLPAAFSSVDSMKDDLEMAMMFTEQVVHDVLVCRLAPHRVVHVDSLPILEELASMTESAVWSEFARKISALRQRIASTALNFPFQLKALFATLAVH